MLIRINPIEPAVIKGKGFGLRMGSLEGIRGLRGHWESRDSSSRTDPVSRASRRTKRRHRARSSFSTACQSRLAILRK